MMGGVCVWKQFVGMVERGGVGWNVKGWIYR
jgi:hypothetical protein